MTIKRYTADADTTITNAFKQDLILRGTGSNMGAADILEVFSIYGQVSSSASGNSQEISRCLIKFPTAGITTDRAAGTIPVSGSVNFFLKMYNAEHHNTAPQNYDLAILAVSESWAEGSGMDLDEYRDADIANWDLRDIATLAPGTATILGNASLHNASGTSLILRNADGSTVTFTTNSSLNYDAATADIGDHTWKVNTGAISVASPTARATQAIYTAVKGAIDAGELDMTISPASYTNETYFTLTQTTSGAAGNTAITLITGITALGETAFTGGADDLASLTWGGGLASAKGGTFHTGTVADSRYHFPEFRYTTSIGENVAENVEVDITPLMEHWIAGTLANNGVGIMLSGTYEDGTNLRSYYTKKFFARTTEFFFKKPVIEARWNSSKKDDRSNFYASSPLATTAENTNTITLYNYLRGGLVNIPSLHSSNTLTVKLYRDSLTDTGFAATAKITALSKTAGQANTRVLTAHDAEGQSVSFTIDNSISTSTATKIAFANANSNATQFATNIAAAINAADTANTLNISATSADAVVTLTMNTVGSAGNSVSDIAGTAATDSVLTITNQFAGGGATAIIGGLTADTGIYTASFALDTTASVVYDVWSTGSTEFFTGTIDVNTFAAADYNPNQLYVTSLPNLKSSYSRKETARFRFFTRKQNWSPTIYTKATETLSSEIVDSAYYRIFRVSDEYNVIPYGTGSQQSTKMSYDRSGSYFDLDMSMFQADYAYGLSVAYYLNGKYVEQPEVFKFRVEE